MISEQYRPIPMTEVMSEKEKAWRHPSSPPAICEKCILPDCQPSSALCLEGALVGLLGMSGAKREQRAVREDISNGTAKIMEREDGAWMVTFLGENTKTKRTTVKKSRGLGKGLREICGSSLLSAAKLSTWREVSAASKQQRNEREHITV